MRKTSRRAAGPSVLVGLAVLVAGCASRNTAHSASPPKLLLAQTQLDSARAASGAAALAPGSGAVDRPAFAGFGGYVLAGTLPDKPTHAPVWRWAKAPATEKDVVKLGKALGVTGTPQRHPYGWLLSSATGEVRVSDAVGSQWSYTRADLVTCSPYMVDIDHNPDGSTSSGCGVAVSPDQAIPNGPDDAAARAAVAPLIAALGVKGDEQVSPGAPASSVMVSPEVGGLPTQGIETSIDVDSKGVRSAFGRLTTPAAGDDYPLRTAKQGFTDLSNRPHIMMGLAMPYCGPMPDGGPVPLGSDAATPPDSAPGAKLAPSTSATAAVGSAPTAIAASPPTEPNKPIQASGAPEPAPVSSGPADHPYSPHPLPIVSCPPPTPQKVTGATLGLQLSYEGNGSNGLGSEVLVPAWFFTIEGETTPTPVIAIDPAFLGTPEIDPGFTGSSGSSGGGGGTVGSATAQPGSVGPGFSTSPLPPQPVTVPPAKPSS
ncbi:MAG: hypothetical protein QOG69_2653 [Actinomycetota bacterium]|nr:hypothetical protein [Actinomycetota bacterium]